MAYNEFAYYYDSLMDEQYYIEYEDFLRGMIKDYYHILELGCGTGTLSILIKSMGKDLLASDLSADMLQVAKQKAEELDLPLDTEVIDMIHFNKNEEYDAILCLTDGMNYLSNLEEVKQTFLNVYSSLRKGGRWIFDVHSMHKINVTFLDYSEHEEEHNEEYDYCFDWHVKRIDEGKIEHHVVIEEDGKKMVDEKHIQQTYPVETYLQLLKESGFIKIAWYGDFKEYTDECERVIFVADK